MRRWRHPFQLALLGLLLAATASAQEKLRGSDVPSGPATLRGQVVHAQRSEAAAGVDVVLYALPAQGSPGLRRAESDASGRFVFTNISNDPRTSYLVGARFAGVAYPGSRVVFAPGELEREVEVRIADVTPDAAEVRVREVDVRVVWRGGELQVQKTVRFENQGKRSVYTPKELRSQREAAFRTRLPEGAHGFSMPLGIVPDGVEQGEREFAFFGPLYPGEQELSFSYSVPVREGSMQLEFLFATDVERVRVLLPEDGPAAQAAILTPGEPLTLEGRRYRSLLGGPLAKGGRLELALDLPALRRETEALALREVRIFLELDEAALMAREEFQFEVDGGTPVVGSEQAPLLRIPLPEGAHNLAFSPDYGLAPGPTGGIEVQGPIPAGESKLEILYRLPIPGTGVELERRFAAGFPLLSVFVADTGLVAESDRLHRKRPVRGSDRTFIHLEAFEIEADEVIAMRFVPLAPRAGLARSATLVLLLIGAGGAFAFLSGPLLRAPPRTDAPAPEETRARRERESVIAALRDLDHDYETGKLSDEDHQLLREELRARAVELLREERDAARSQAPSILPGQDRVPPVCPNCNAEPRVDDRFCARCGTSLAPESAAEQGSHR